MFQIAKTINLRHTNWKHDNLKFNCNFIESLSFWSLFIQIISQLCCQCLRWLINTLLSNKKRILPTPPHDLYEFLVWLTPVFVDCEHDHQLRTISTKSRKRDQIHDRNQNHTTPEPNISQPALAFAFTGFDTESNPSWNFNSNSNSRSNLIVNNSNRGSARSGYQAINSSPMLSHPRTLVQKFETHMRQYRKSTLIMDSNFDRFIPAGLLVDILNIIVSFELGASDVQSSAQKFLTLELQPSISSYVGYFLGVYQNFCMMFAVIMHATQYWTTNSQLEADGNEFTSFFVFKFVLCSWVLAIILHVTGAVVLWKRGKQISHRVRQLKYALKILQRQLEIDAFNKSILNHHSNKLEHSCEQKYDDDTLDTPVLGWNSVSSLRSTVVIVDEPPFEIDTVDEKEAEQEWTNTRTGEAFLRLQRFCNVHKLEVDNNLHQVKLLILILQKYVLPGAIVVCVAIDPLGQKWYAYISVLVYYLHLHVLYEVFHNERHAMVAFARVTLFWAIFISIVAAIASATDSQQKHDKDKQNEANFLAGIAGLLLFGIFIAVFDICWFFSDTPSKTRLTFFVVLINCCYFAGCLYMFHVVQTFIMVLIIIALYHCQIVYNQVIDALLYNGEIDEYLESRIEDKFYKSYYWQALLGTSLIPEVEPSSEVTSTGAVSP